MVTNVPKVNIRHVASVGVALAGGVAAAIQAPTSSPGADGVELHAAKQTPQAAFKQPTAFEGTAHKPGEEVQLQYAPQGRGYRAVDTTKSDGQGRFRLTALPDENGSLRAVTEDGEASKPRPVEVSPRLAGNTEHDQVVGRSVGVSGALGTPGPGRPVALQVLGPRGWQPVAQAATDQQGLFNVNWNPPGIGTYALRLAFGGDGQNTASTASVPGQVNVYRPTEASWYQLDNQKTACGQTLNSSTPGVANLSLPCGTPVTLSYNGRKVTVPVIDRGPYVSGRTWDLTYATKQQLGVDSTATVLANR